MIRWITDNLGTCAFDPMLPDEEIYVLDIRDMVDKAGNTDAMIREKIGFAVNEINSGKKVVISCDYGISRSNGIAIGVYATLYSIDFYNAAYFVMDKIGKHEIKPEILSAVYHALTEGSVIEKETKKNILLTGGTGFIGSKVCALLKMNHNVWNPSRQELDLVNDLFSLDLFVKKNRISTIVHFANPRIINSIRAMGETLVMLKNILAVCECNPIHLVYMSGWEVYSGYKTKGLLASEELPLLPKGIYGETKLLCETLIKNVSREGQIKYTIIRSSPVYGQGSDKPKFIYNFLDKAMKSQPITVHKYINSLPCLDLLFIEDLAEVLMRIVESENTGDFNIGTGQLTSTTEIAEFIIDIIGGKKSIKTVDILSSCANIAMDSTKAIHMYEWKPKVSIRAGIEEIIKSMRKESENNNGFIPFAK